MHRIFWNGRTGVKDAHPKEILTFWASRHGDSGPTGTDQYPDTTPAIRQAFFKQVEATFQGMLFDTTDGPLNTIPVSEMWKRGQRVVWYAADYAESTGNSTLAMNSRNIDNTLPGAGDGYVAFCTTSSATSSLLALQRCASVLHCCIAADAVRSKVWVVGFVPVGAAHTRG